MGEAYDRLRVDDFQLLAAVLALILPVDGHGHVRALSGGEGYLRAVGEQEGIDDGVGRVDLDGVGGAEAEEPFTVIVYARAPMPTEYERA